MEVAAAKIVCGRRSRAGTRALGCSRFPCGPRRTNGPFAVDMAREELARLLACLLERGQSARRDDLAEFESRLFAELLHRKNSFRWFWFCFLEAPQRAVH